MNAQENDKRLAELVKYRKTENGYQVQVETWVNIDGTQEFFEQDVWDLRGYPFTPCVLEREFANSLRGRPRTTELPHLNLDEEVEQKAAIDWLMEPEAVATGIALINDTLGNVSLLDMNGEHLLLELTGALRRGRELADKKHVAEKAVASEIEMETVIEQQIAHWLRKVERLVAASSRNGRPPQAETDEAAYPASSISATEHHLSREERPMCSSSR